mgnify:CR=1 FL=1
MTKKKSLLALAMALCLIIPATFMLTACGNKSISEKGKTYTVLNKQSDITINWGDDKETLMEEVGSEENAKAMCSTFILIFDENGGVKISTGGESDDGWFYVINEDNCIEFYNTQEDAENKLNRVTDDYLGAEYKFSADKRVITIKQQISAKTSVVIKLSANV